MLVGLWQSADDPETIFFLMDVESVEQANAFMARPESREIGTKSGVVDGEVHFLYRVDEGDEPPNEGARV